MTPEQVYGYLLPLFKRKIEDITEDEIKHILKTSYNAEMPALLPIPYFGEGGIVTYDYGELVALCPITTLTDLYRSIITFIPDNYVCELKSLRFYYLAYRTLPISHELLASKIYTEFKRAVKPKKLNLKLGVSVRGGITTTIELGNKIDMLNFNQKICL